MAACKPVSAFASRSAAAQSSLYCCSTVRACAMAAADWTRASRHCVSKLCKIKMTERPSPSYSAAVCAEQTQTIAGERCILLQKTDTERCAWLREEVLLVVAESDCDRTKTSEKAKTQNSSERRDAERRRVPETLA